MRENLFVTLGGAVNNAVEKSAEAGQSSVAVVREKAREGWQYWTELAADLPAQWDDAIVCTVEAPVGPRRWQSPESAHAD